MLTDDDRVQLETCRLAHITHPHPYNTSSSPIPPIPPIDAVQVETCREALEAATTDRDEMLQRLGEAQDAAQHLRRKRLLASKYRPDAAIEVAKVCRVPLPSFKPLSGPYLASSADHSAISSHSPRSLFAPLTNLPSC